MKKTSRKNEPRMNERIRVPEVRVIGPDGKQLGIMDTKEALAMAKEMGLDLVEVAPNAQPPVCRIMDWGKYKYEQAKKEKQAKKKARHNQIKEMQFRPKISEHDFMIKIKKVKEFIEDGYKVKVVVRLRGRELETPEIAKEMIYKIRDEIADVAKMENRDLKLEGRQMVVMFFPKK